MSKSPKNQQGFTLLEVLIVTLIFSIMSMMAWQLLRGANEISRQARYKTASIGELHRLWLILRRDLYQVVAADPPIAVHEQEIAYTTKDPFAGLTDAERGETRKVTWQVKGSQLIRTIQVQKAETPVMLSQRVFLENVNAVKWSFYDGGWKTTWRADAYPDLVAAEFSLADGRAWRWVFQTDAGNLMRVGELDNRAGGQDQATQDRAAE